MSDQFIPARPSFQLRNSADGIAAAYLAWKLSERVEVVESGCWEWAGAKTARGYGIVHLKNWDWPESTVTVHRLAYQLCVSPIPDGMSVCHRCDNPPCCRPDHLFLGTDADNIADKVNKGRQANGQKVRTNHEHLKGEVVATAIMTADKVMEMRRREHDGEPLQDLAEEFGVSPTQANSIVRGKAWAHLPVFSKNRSSYRPCPKCGGVFSTRGGIHRAHVASCQRCR